MRILYDHILLNLKAKKRTTNKSLQKSKYKLYAKSYNLKKRSFKLTKYFESQIWLLIYKKTRSD